MDVVKISDFSINLSCLVITLPLIFQAKGGKDTYVPSHASKGNMIVKEEVMEVPT